MNKELRTHFLYRILLFIQHYSGNNKMNVRVILQGPSIGVQYTEHTALTFETSPTKLLYTGRSTEEKGLVEISQLFSRNVPKKFRQCERNHEVITWQQLLFLLIQPLGGAVVLTIRAKTMTTRMVDKTH